MGQENTASVFCSDSLFVCFLNRRSVYVFHSPTLSNLDWCLEYKWPLGQFTTSLYFAIHDYYKLLGTIYVITTSQGFFMSPLQLIFKSTPALLASPRQFSLAYHSGQVKKREQVQPEEEQVRVKLEHQKDFMALPSVHSYKYLFGTPLNKTKHMLIGLKPNLSLIGEWHSLPTETGKAKPVGREFMAQI